MYSLTVHTTDGHEYLMSAEFTDYDVAVESTHHLVQTFADVTWSLTRADGTIVAESLEDLA